MFAVQRSTAWPRFRQDLAIAARTTDDRCRELELTQSAGRARSLTPVASAFKELTERVDSADLPAAADAFRQWRVADDAFAAKWPPGSAEDRWTLPYTLTEADRQMLSAAARAIEDHRDPRMEQLDHVGMKLELLLGEVRRGRLGVEWKDCATDITDALLRWNRYNRRLLSEDRDGSMPRVFRAIDAAHSTLATAIAQGDFRAAKSACERSNAGAEAFDREFPE